MMRFEGEHSVFDIAEQVGLEYSVVRDYVEKFRAKGFITPLPIPSEAQST
jgi:DNA-binding MarR family transcriptional regulator